MDMKKLPLPALPAASLILAAALTVFSISAMADGVEPSAAAAYKDVVIRHRIVTPVRADGSAYELGLATFEHQPADGALPAAACPDGRHTAKAYTGAPDTERVHLVGMTHPGNCTMVTRREWACADCGLTGVDVSTMLVWCAGAAETKTEEVPFMEDLLLAE